LYTDEGSSNILLRDNVVYHLKCAGFHQHYGLDNTITNNVIAGANQGNCDSSVRSSQHDGNCSLPAVGEAQGACSSFIFETNIVYADVGTYGPMVEGTIPTGLKNMTFYDNTYWSVVTGSVMTFNATSFQNWQNNGKDVGSLPNNPLFVDPNDNNWSDLQATSPSMQIGFQPIDVSQVGPRGAVGSKKY